MNNFNIYQFLYKIGVQQSSFANYILFKEYIYDSNGSGKIIGIKAFDRIQEKEIEIKASLVVNCTGITCDDNIPKIIK